MRSVLNSNNLDQSTRSIDRLGVLSDLAGPKRISHIRGVLKFCEDALLDPKYQDREILRELLSLHHNILRYERFRKPPGYQQIVETIQRSALPSVSKMIRTETEPEVLREMVDFLWDTDREQSVRVLFEVIERLSDQTYDELKPRLFQALFRESSTLHNAQDELISRNIDRLLKKGDPRIKERAEELSSESRSGSYHY